MLPQVGDVVEVQLFSGQCVAATIKAILETVSGRILRIAHDGVTNLVGLSQVLRVVASRERSP